MKNLIYMFRKYFKHKFIKVITFKNDRGIKYNYYTEKDFQAKLDNKELIINVNHMFIDNGYRTFVTTDKLVETLDPLDTESTYPVEKFRTAIKTRVVEQTFNSMKKNKLDIQQLLLMGIAGGVLVLIYYLVVMPYMK